MTDIAYPNTWRTTLVFSQANGDFAENVLHWRVPSGAFDLAEATGLANALLDAWAGHMAGITGTRVSLLKVKVQDLRSVPYATYDVDTPRTGIDSSQQLPYQLAAVLSWHTAEPGRRGRGRTYVGGLCEDANDIDGQMTTAVNGQLLDYANALQAIVLADAVAVELAVLSRANVASYAVVAPTVDRRWDVQRRRANRRSP